MKFAIVTALLSLSTIAVATPVDIEAKACKKKPGVANGNFETGVTAPWSSAGDSGYTFNTISPGAGGSQFAASLNAPANTDGGSPTEAQIFNGVSRLCKNKKYTLSFDYAGATANQDHALSVTFGAFQVYQYQGVFPATYTHVEVNVTAPGTSSFVNFLYLNFDAGGAIPLYLDNIKVTKAF